MKRLLSALSASVLLVTAIILTPFAAAVNNNPTVADRVIDLSKSQLLITSDNTAMTVSYTHLDVYKRQVHKRNRQACFYFNT